MQSHKSHKLALGFANWGAEEVSVIEMIKTVKCAIENDIDEIDCAPHYGNGARETVLGAALLDFPQEQRSKIKITTKVGRTIDPNYPTKNNNGFQNANNFSQHFDYSYAGILASFKQSQLRLNLGKVHALYLHDLDKVTHGKKHQKRLEAFLKEGYQALHQLKQSGYASSIGIGSNDLQICIDLIKDGRFEIDRILLTGCYNLLNFDVLNEFFPLCATHKIAVYIAAPYCGGILSGNDNPFYKYEQADATTLKRVEALNEVCKEYKVDLAHAAMQFVHLHPQVRRVVVGARIVQELEKSLHYARNPLSPKFWQALKDKGLIPKNAPTEAPLNYSASPQVRFSPPKVCANSTMNGSVKLRSRL